MRLLENSRLFVGGIPPGTGDADLRRHFSRYGDVVEICLPRDRITGRPRRFAFVQFTRPSDAGRALADQRHVINGRQVQIGKAEPRKSFTPLCHRIFRSGNDCYRVGDTRRIAIALCDDWEDNEYVNEAKKFGVIVDKALIFNCIIGYISEDGKECLIRWPPVQRDDESARSCQGIPVYDCWHKYKSASTCQGTIIPSYDCPLKDLANIASNRPLGESSATNSPEDAKPAQNWCWLVSRGY